jgi:hypothetical protein
MRARMMMWPSIPIGELCLTSSLCYLILVRVLLLICFIFVPCCKRGSSLSSSRAQVPIALSLVQGGDDIFATTMPLPKSSVRLGGVSLRRKTAK